MMGSRWTGLQSRSCSKLQFRAANKSPLSSSSLVDGQCEPGVRSLELDLSSMPLLRSTHRSPSALHRLGSSLDSGCLLAETSTPYALATGCVAMLSIQYSHPYALVTCPEDSHRVIVHVTSPTWSKQHVLCDMSPPPVDLVTQQCPREAARLSKQQLHNTYYLI